MGGGSKGGGQGRDEGEGKKRRKGEKRRQVREREIVHVLMADFCHTVDTHFSSPLISRISII